MLLIDVMVIDLVIVISISEAPSSTLSKSKELYPSILFSPRFRTNFTQNSSHYFSRKINFVLNEQIETSRC